MGDTVVSPGADSAAAQPNFDLSSFTPEQYSTWESTGKVPDVKPAADTSDAAKPTESQAGAPEGDEPAAESATASQEQPSKGKGADARKAQLSAEIQDLLRKRNELRAEVDGPKKDVKPAAEASTAEAPKIERPKRPVFGESGHEAETWEQFETRQDSYIEAIADYKAAARLQASEAEKAKQAEERQRADQAAEIDKTFRERIGKATEKHADYAEVAFSAEVPITQPMDAFIRSQEAGAEVLYYLGQHPAAAKAIAAMQPLDAFYALSKIALSLEQPAQADPPKKEAPVVPITRAAKPATDIRATSAAIVDELEAARKAGDYTRYEELANRRDAEARRRG